MSLHATASPARLRTPAAPSRIHGSKGGNDWAWSHISPDEHHQAMQMQQAYGNAYVAQTMGPSLHGSSLPMAPSIDEEEPIEASTEATDLDALEPEEDEEEVPLAPAMSEEEQPIETAVPEEEEQMPMAPIVDQEEAVNAAVQQSNEDSKVEGTPEKATMEEEFEPEQGGEHNDEDLPIKEEIEEEPEFEEEEDAGASMAAAPMPRISFHDGGMSGAAPVGIYRVRDSDARPRAYTDGGKTGTIAWAGGGGAGPHGNENVGSIQTEQGPSYIAQQSGSDPANAYTQGGVTDVTRSYVGAVSGDQSNGFWVSARAAARLNQHEQQHVDSTRRHYNENLLPLAIRLAISPALGLRIAPDTTGAITAMKAQIRWAASVAAFQAGDNADNYPMNTVDTNDLASGTYPVHAGPGRAHGKRYTQRLKMPGEAIPRR